MNDKNDKIIEKINKIILDIGYLLLLFIVNTVIVATLFQFVSIQMSIKNVILSSIVTFIEYIIISKKNKRKNIIIIISFLLSILIVFTSTFIISKTYDLTCDGNYYHKVAVGLIKEGWNPAKQSSYDFSKEKNADISDKNVSLWIDHYPKATWNFAASIYSITNNIESGKVITILFIISLTFILYGYLSKRYLNCFQSIIVSVLITLNPIILSQIFSYYLDGVLGLTVYLIILFLVMLTDKKYSEIPDLGKWIGLAYSIIFCINVKFTGLLFSGIFCICFYIFWLIKLRKEKDFIKNFIKLTCIFAGIVVFAVGIVGYSSYVKNTIDYKNPLYPLFGKNKVDIITTMQPASFENKLGISKLFESLFSKSENVTYNSGNSPKFKLPFEVSDNEVNNCSIPDLRIGGYGILFSGIFIISIFTIILSLIVLNKQKQKDNCKKIDLNILIVIIIGIIITTLMMTESWWARYAPQLYLLPIVALIYLFRILNFKSVEKSNVFKKFIEYSLSIILIVTMTLNLLPFIKWRIKDFKISRNIERSMYSLEHNLNGNTVNIYIEPNSYKGVLFNLNDKKINYKVDNKIDGKFKSLYNTWIKY